MKKKETPYNLVKQGFQTYGIDIASSAIEMVAKWVKSEGLTKTVKLSVGDVHTLP